MTNRGWTLPLICILAAGSAAADQHKEKKDAPKPAAAPAAAAFAPMEVHKKLAYFVGDWKMEGDLKENPFMPAGKMSGVEKCKWHAGKFAVVCNSTGKGPLGEMIGLGIMTWDMSKQDYMYFGMDNRGWAETAHGTQSGDTWTYMNESTYEGKTFKGRWIMETGKADEYSYKWDLSDDGGSTWKTVMEGKNTRMKAAAGK